MTKPHSIVDVRTPEEFAGGHVPGSINIPLNEVPERVEELRALPNTAGAVLP
ncbi:MAG: rhodanese-like domain-containing protein [Flavobacteriales bacterium]|nr:rhodanese-like domain-containing protein [Flavobacteriales bacterium]